MEQLLRLIMFIMVSRMYPFGGVGYKTTVYQHFLLLRQQSRLQMQVCLYQDILGEGATFSVVVDRAGSITTINLTNPGEDYVSKPNVSIKVQDILVSNVSATNLPLKR
jgi:hypothetical protein